MTKRSLLLLSLSALLLAGWVGSATAGPKPEGHLDGLGAKDRKEIVEAARRYFDPTIEFLYAPRKGFVAALGALAANHGLDALKDVGVLREIVYQGRGFKPRFSDKKWRSLHDVKEFKKTGSLYLNLKSEDYRFTYTLPKSYPKEGALEKKVPRVAPYPLVVSFHDDLDTVNKKNETEPYPGAAALERRYPKGDFADLYQSWLLLAPVAPRAKFVDDDGNIRQRLVIKVLREFWQRYHIDFERIVLDGGDEAVALTAMFPGLFAGLVLRDGEIDPAVVPNLAAVPIYVVGKPELKKALDAAGHGDVTVGDAKGLEEWLNQRQRKTPKKFKWRVLGPQHIVAHWVTVNAADISSSPTLDIEVLDTEENPNTIRVDTKAVEEISLSLNDEIVDLDREVLLLLNGEKSSLGVLERDFSRLFEKQPIVRKNMLFSWLYPAFRPGVLMPETTEEEEAPETPTEPADVTGTPTDEANAKKFWDKAVAAENDGDKDKAKRLYQRVIDVGATSLRGKARLKLEELQ